MPHKMWCRSFLGAVEHFADLSTGSGGAKLLVSNSKSGATSAKESLTREMLLHQNSVVETTSEFLTNTVRIKQRRRHHDLRQLQNSRLKEVLRRFDGLTASQSLNELTGFLDSGGGGGKKMQSTVSASNLGNGGNGDGDSANVGQTRPNSTSDGVMLISTLNFGKSSWLPADALHSADPLLPANALHSAGLLLPADALHFSGSSLPADVLHFSGSSLPADALHFSGSSLPADALHSAGLLYLA
ncbi:hypothetical protein Tco_1516748 [Tanacetum coccineum]